MEGKQLTRTSVITPEPPSEPEPLDPGQEEEPPREPEPGDLGSWAQGIRDPGFRLSPDAHK